MKLYMFRTVPLSIIRSFSLYTQQWYMSYRFADSLRAGSGWNCSSILILLANCQQTVWRVSLLCVQWKTPDDGQRNCPKHVEFHFKNKNFEKLLHLIGFIIRNISNCMGLWRWCVIHWHYFILDFVYPLIFNKTRPFGIRVYHRLRSKQHLLWWTL